MKNMCIGVLGGMGTYATINVFRQYAEIFPAEKEWDRPRIIIDNKCTMPSRVRAFLYDENVDILVSEMVDSIKSLIYSGCNRIILACNTSHLFLPKIFEKYPESKKYIVNIIDVCSEYLCHKAKKVFLLGSEATIESKLYQQALIKYGIETISPDKSEYSMIRNCIEAVKQNKYTEEIEEIFCSLINRYDSCILGCTELPVLYDRCRKSGGVKCDNVIDPLYLSLTKLKKEYYETKILTFGVYDYFHLGHLRLFKQCKEYADYLIVAVQNGDYILKFKPDARVLYSTSERIEMISSLKMVDEVIMYDTVCPDVLQRIDFDILALGEDHIGERFDNLINWCVQNSKKVVRLKRTPGISSSEIKLKK